MKRLTITNPERLFEFRLKNNWKINWIEHNRDYYDFAVSQRPGNSYDYWIALERSEYGSGWRIQLETADMYLSHDEISNPHTFCERLETLMRKFGILI